MAGNLNHIVSPLPGTDRFAHLRNLPRPTAAQRAEKKRKKFVKLQEQAHAAGMKAAEAAQVVPMIVGSPTTFLGNDIDPTKQTYFVEGGVCGFAWVNIKPASCGFAKYLVEAGLGRKDSYEGGIRVWVSQFGQSMQRKEAYAHAYAQVIRESGIEKVWAFSRMD